MVIKTNREEMSREAGYVSIRNNAVELRSRTLFDTLRIPIDSCVSITCFENLPFGTALVSSIGGGLAGFLVGKAGGESWNKDFPVGLAIIGAGIGGVSALVSTRETCFLIDPLAPIPATQTPVIPNNLPAKKIRR